MRMNVFAASAIAALAAACGNPKAEEARNAAPSPAATEPSPSETAVNRAAAPAGHYKADPGHAYLTFNYNHMGYSNPTIRWGEWSADLDWNPSNPEQSSVAATINVSSVDTGVAKLDEHLKSPDFFDAGKFPTITFKSTGLTADGANAGKMTGDLTIKGVTNPVTLDVKINKAADDGFVKAYKIGFSAIGKLTRSDFGVDRYVPVVSDEIPFAIEAEFVMPKDAAAGE